MQMGLMWNSRRKSLQFVAIIPILCLLSIEQNRLRQQPQQWERSPRDSPSILPIEGTRPVEESTLSLYSNGYRKDNKKFDRILNFTGRVIIHQGLQSHTGGPEALVQLALASYQANVTSTFAFIPGRLLPNDMEYWHKLYPDFAKVPKLTTHKDFRPGDLYIIPEMQQCPRKLVAKGIHVYIFILATLDKPWKLPRKPCHYVSHNHWLAKRYHLTHVPVLRPYMNPSKDNRRRATSDRSDASTTSNSTFISLPKSNDRENIILINVHGSITSSVLTLFENYCSRTNEKGFINTTRQCTVIRLEKFSATELVDLYYRAKVIVAFCMNGSERCPIEAALHGMVLLTNDCQSGSSSTLDFPMPRRNVLSSALFLDRKRVPEQEQVMDASLTRILENFDEEQEDYRSMRELYHFLSPDSLKQDVLDFYHYLSIVGN